MIPKGKIIVEKTGYIENLHDGVSITDVNIRQFGKVVNVFFVGHLENVDITNGQIILGNLAGVSLPNTWMKMHAMIGENEWMLTKCTRLALDTAGLIYIEDDAKTGYKWFNLNFTYITDK